MALILDVPWLLLTRSVVPDSPGTMRIAVSGMFGLAGVFLQLNCSSWENVLSQMFGILAILCSLAKRSVSYYFFFFYKQTITHGLLGCVLRLNILTGQSKSSDPPDDVCLSARLHTEIVQLATLPF